MSDCGIAFSRFCSLLEGAHLAPGTNNDPESVAPLCVSAGRAAVSVRQTAAANILKSI